MVQIVSSTVYRHDFPRAYPADLAMDSTDILPSGFAARTSVWINDKLDVAFCNGKDQWYREQDKPVDAGQPASALFE